MFNTIIVGVDGREGGRDALALAASLQRIFGGELVAAHAFPYDCYVSRGSDADFEAVMHGHALETAKGEIERAGVTARAVAVPDGSPGRALHRAVNGHGGDLIVVGSAHRGPVGRVLAGDVTAGTLHGSPCPMAVAPAGYAVRGGELKAIGVGFDGSPESRAGVELARDVAAAAGAHLRVIGVVEPPTPGGPYAAYRPDWVESAERRREETQERVDAIVAELGDIATGEVVAGDPARELAYAGNELDLMVTGSRGYGPVRRLMLGSTSSKLVREAPCPVLVLARGAEEADDPAETRPASAHAS